MRQRRKVSIGLILCMILTISAFNLTTVFAADEVTVNNVTVKDKNVTISGQIQM